LVPFTFDDDDMNSSSSDAKRRAPTPPDEKRLPLSPRKRDRKLRESAKETDAEQGGFLTAMGSEEGEKSSSSGIKKKKYERTGDWGPVSHPSERPTWGRFMYDEDEKRVAEEWRDTGRRTEKRQQEEHVARGNSPTKKGKEESSAFDDLNTTYIDPFDGPPPKPKSSTLFITGG
jgi:hypothetical protein